MLDRREESLDSCPFREENGRRMPMKSDKNRSWRGESIENPGGCLQGEFGSRARF
jgi:hypothetical protein